MRTTMGWSSTRTALLCLFVTGAVLAGLAPRAKANPGYLRYPDLNDDRVVFCAEGDLWIAPIAGGEARRLTTNPGTELFPKFSPDGKWIAFAGQYDGNTDLYVIPATGGEPVRLTWHPAGDGPLGWSVDGKEIYFGSNRDNPHWQWEVFRIPATGGEPTKVPVGYVVSFAVDPETGDYAFTRNGGGGTWKRYRGGTADDIWVGDPKQGEYRKITSFDGMDASPMWHDGRICFLCDQGGTANLWSMKPDGTDRTRLTSFDKWDARWPSIDANGRIAFAVAADIHLYDPATGTEHTIPIDLPSERNLTRVRYPDPGQYFTEFALAPDGDRVAIGARGEIFSVPAKDGGVTLPITRGNGSREDRVAYGPKGTRVLYVTDEGGEQQIVTADAWGRRDLKPVDKSAQSHWHYQPAWSPDGMWIAWGDETQSLWVQKADGSELSNGPHKVDHSDGGEVRDYAWSPDGRWLAYTKLNTIIEYGAIFIYDTKDGSTHQVTSWTNSSNSPTWDPDGRYLYFLSDRHLDPIIDRVDFETVVVGPTRPYLVLLRKDVENPFAKGEGAPPKDGDKKDKDKDKDKAKDDKDKKGKDDKGGDEDKPPEPVVIDFDGLAGRVVEVPVEAGRYYGLGATSKKLFYLNSPVEGLLGEDIFEDNSAPRATLYSFDLEKKKAKPYLEGVGTYDLQAKSGKIAVMKQRGEIYVLDADSPPGDDLTESKVKLDDIVIELDPREEWRQIFFESWRNMRDFYWDAGMHGLDWPAIRDQYATLLPRVATHDDLQDLVAEMIGELANSHTYVFGGDRGVSPNSVRTGLLGAVLAREGDAFRVARIYRGDEVDRDRSPLAEPQVAVKEGDYILAVNHQPFRPDRPFEASLQNLAGKDVLLTVNSKPTRDGARDAVVEPIDLGDDANLRYHDWVRGNREYVAEKSDGKLGYIHIPDMMGQGLSEFDKWFYPQLDKAGMVVDARWNGGGFVSQLIVSRLARHLMWWCRARWGELSPYPARVLNGPFVVMTNQFAGSDGDIFPAIIQDAGLAPVIGMRSWGGVVGIRGNARPLVDSGILTQPEYAWWDPKWAWGIENHGVDPDIVVDNMPQDVGRGADPQLDRAIEEVVRLQGLKPSQKPQFVPAPDRSRKAYEAEK